MLVQIFIDDPSRKSGYRLRGDVDFEQACKVLWMGDSRCRLCCWGYPFSLASGVTCTLSYLGAVAQFGRLRCTHSKRSRNEEFRLCPTTWAWGKSGLPYVWRKENGNAIDRRFEKGMGRGETNGGGGPFFRMLSYQGLQSPQRLWSLRFAKMVKEQLGPSMRGLHACAADAIFGVDQALERCLLHPSQQR
ncbi:hypothetical protein IFM89_031000 [Coptis chinensis]|uniref:Uncharacterized protein n=1 Tax=Coptis chinensis TaxID=261450 RepID=A0A835LG89_9MAGN|nr:hypothetical protein IFM89_031000 [Coptis chinensis]